VERRPQVKIFGMMHELHAEVVVFDGFSAHADQLGLLEFCEGVRRHQGANKLREIFLVHGEPVAQTALARQLAGRGFSHVTSPSLGERIQLA
jgi:metallo-beta-lactamase family protein